MIDVVKESLNVSLNSPIRSFTGCFDLRQCGMTASIGSKPMGSVLKHWFVDRLQQEPDDFLHELVFE
ncbi:hypothetical protein KDAU_62140 [Dictyobacter aurantiacus]|uniref:Uncharacterized protein n=1 Tax=Dictyobacter aurantiacus TaxID=1936993 RepID=A0A401ZPU4_9CHLR|nr:hypothetical protein KDAU_62140 [Dictyobacter aurantiacus]